MEKGVATLVDVKLLVCENVNIIVLLAYSNFRMTRICPKNNAPLV